MRAKLPAWTSPVDSLAEKVLAVDSTGIFNRAELDSKFQEFLNHLTDFRLRFPDPSLHADTRHVMAPFIRALLHLMAEDAVEVSFEHRPGGVAAVVAERTAELKALELEIEAENLALKILEDVVASAVRAEASEIFIFAKEFDEYVNAVVEHGLVLRRTANKTEGRKKKRGFFSKIKSLFRYVILRFENSEE